MKIYGHIKLGRRRYKPGDEVAWYQVYPFFLTALVIFGAPSYFLAYGPEHPDVGGVYGFGILTITIWLMAYLSIFGPEEVKWMLINAALGVFGIFGQVSWLMSTVFFKEIDDLPWYIHVVPFTLFVLVTFLVRQAFIDLLGARERPERQRVADVAYMVVSVALSVVFLFFNTREGV